MPPKQIKIIGSCPQCSRKVGQNFRPINSSQLSTALLGDAESLASMESEISANNSAVALTDNLLEMLEEEFERPANVESKLTRDHAEVIMAMLKEEQNNYHEVLDAIPNKSPAQPRK